MSEIAFCFCRFLFEFFCSNWVSWFYFLDVDECVELEGVCINKGACENTLGSYKCVCSPGYHGNGTHCTGKKCYKLYLKYLVQKVDKNNEQKCGLITTTTNVTKY